MTPGHSILELNDSPWDIMTPLAYDKSEVVQRFYKFFLTHGNATRY